MLRLLFLIPAVPLAPAAPVTTIPDPETPLAAPSTAAWALVNLILAIISLVFAIALAIGYASRRNGKEANKQKGTQDSRGGAVAMCQLFDAYLLPHVPAFIARSTVSAIGPATSAGTELLSTGTELLGV